MLIIVLGTYVDFSFIRCVCVSAVSDYCYFTEAIVKCKCMICEKYVRFERDCHLVEHFIYFRVDFAFEN